MRLLITIMPGIAVALVACSRLHQPGIAYIAGTYTNFHKITKNAIFVNPRLAELCVGVTEEQLAQEKRRHGPHANTSILIYMNDLARHAFEKKVSFPVGSVVVKRKSILGSVDQGGRIVRNADTGVGGMVKRPPGYDPEHGDWEYFYFEDPAKIETGRIASCVKCHASAKETDYVFGTWREARESRLHQFP